MTMSMVPSEWGEIVGLPRIDRYFPDCWSATIEAVARYLFQIADFGKIYGFHTFRYTKPEGPIEFRKNGVELDLELHREPLTPVLLNAGLEDIYALHTEILTFTDLADYWEFCRDSIGRKVPVVTDFDLKFIKARREYGKVDNPHIIALYGYDPSSSALLAAEQMLGSTTISVDDFSGCFENMIRTVGVVRVWRLVRLAGAERPLGPADLLTRLQENLRNLDSDNPRLGLAGLRSFREDLAQYLDGPTFENRPFAVPGAWVFSHERHIQKKWLASAARVCANTERLASELDELLSQSFKIWLATDFLMEKCLGTKNGKALRAFPKYLTDALLVEERLRDGWRELHALVSKS